MKIPRDIDIERVVMKAVMEVPEYVIEQKALQNIYGTTDFPRFSAPISCAHVRTGDRSFLFHHNNVESCLESGSVAPLWCKPTLSAFHAITICGNPPRICDST